MDISNKAIWQQAAGDTDRDYSEICLKWGVILNGPGYAGPWPECKLNLQNDGWSAKKVFDLRRFAEDMADGDLLVLRIGTASILGVGQIVGSYEWSQEFGDIDGWNLQHVRRVRWLWNGRQNFESYALKLGDTTQKMNVGPVTELLAHLPVPDDAWIRPLVALPAAAAGNDISVDKISEFLFDHGVASASITNLVNEIGELTRIAKWYQRAGMPSEHETIAYLVVPILRALGWTPQRMAVEWNKVDVALFERLPRSDNSLRIVVEAKKMDNSCLTAKPQAMSYAQGKGECNRLIVTDGLRYGVYVRSKGEMFSLYAYMNLTRFRDHYPIYGCKGAEDALLAMAPEWKADVDV
jgi:hypothetical protein